MEVEREGDPECGGGNNMWRWPTVMAEWNGQVRGGGRAGRGRRKAGSGSRWSPI